MNFYSDGLPVGTPVATFLTEAQFQAEKDLDLEEWVLSDGRDVTGSRYNTITGNTTIPDIRGHALRGKNNSRADGKQDPSGENALGTYQDTQNLSHTHPITDHNHGIQATSASAPGGTNVLQGSNAATNLFTFNSNNQSLSPASNGGSEARPRSTVCNWMIRIN